MSTTKTTFFRFIFYSFITALIIYVGAKSQPDEARLFLESWNLWREPLLAGMLCGLLAALLGVYILLNRIVFISLAISQGAGFGIFLSFFIAGLFGITLGESPLSLAAGLLMAWAAALSFAWLKKSPRISSESLIGLIYIAASGLTLLLGDRVAEGHHSIDNLLFGNAVAVNSGEFKVLLALTLPLLFIHFIFRREFIYVSADPEFIRIKGLGSRFWTILLYFTLTLGITLNLKVLGSLPVFALMVIPPFIALKRAGSMREAFLISLLLGWLLPPLGYYFSFLYSFPTGASLIGVGLIYLLASWVESLLFRFAFKKIPRVA